MRVFKVELKEKYEFCGIDGRNPTLTCYLPRNIVEMGRADEMRPTILICPGGGYAECSEREAEPIALKFLNWGYNAIILRYSCAPHRYPVQLCEVAAAFEEIYKNADDWHCDTTKIGIIGFSAGGHLVAHYSNAYSSKEVRTVFPNSKKPNFSVLCYPVLSAEKGITHEDSIVNLLGEFPTDVSKYSCEAMVTKDTPPTFIWHTAEDQIVPVKNSLVYAEALAANGVPFSLHIYPYGEHGLATCDAITNPPERIEKRRLLSADWIEDLNKWINAVF